MIIDQSIQLWTIGHSTRSLDEFLDLLRSAKIDTLADVRRFPGSRRMPHFNRESLADALTRAGIDYLHLEALGGRRQPRGDSPNSAWRNDAFRGYADYMMTPEFQLGLDRLVACARKKRTAIMCAEALWWQCHRALISDFVKARGGNVLHLISKTKIEPHRFTAAARVVDGKLSYSAAESELQFLF